MSYEQITGADFESDIARMNATYELGSIDNIVKMAGRLADFKVILGKEFKELEDIITELDAALSSEQTQDFSALYLRILVMLADLLGDIIVYCNSEAQRYNIPLPEVLACIMNSNFTKLGADGKPIKDENGKFLKGPNFLPPEPAIENVLRKHLGMPMAAINYEEQPDGTVTQVDPADAGIAATQASPTPDQA